MPTGHPAHVSLFTLARLPPTRTCCDTCTPPSLTRCGKVRRCFTQSARDCGAVAGGAGCGTQTCALGASPSPREPGSSAGPSRPWREECAAMRAHVPHPRSEGQNTGQPSLLRGEKACEPRSEQKGLHQHLVLARSPSEVCGHRQEGQGGKSSPWNKGWPASPSHPRTGTTDAGWTHSKTKGSPKWIVR